MTVPKPPNAGIVPNLTPTLDTIDRRLTDLEATVANLLDVAKTIRDRIGAVEPVVEEVRPCRHVITDLASYPPDPDHPERPFPPGVELCPRCQRARPVQP